MTTVGGRNWRRGLTLVELVAVILIVGILAAIAIPIMSGRVVSAKWSEGKAIMGTIAAAIRFYAAEKNKRIDDMAAVNIFSSNGLGFEPGDLSGAYFEDGDFLIKSGLFDPETNTLEFVVRANRPLNSGIAYPDAWELDQNGNWEEIAGGP